MINQVFSKIIDQVQLFHFILNRVIRKVKNPVYFVFASSGKLIFRRASMSSVPQILFYIISRYFQRLLRIPNCLRDHLQKVFKFVKFLNIVDFRGSYNNIKKEISIFPKVHSWFHADQGKQHPKVLIYSCKLFKYCCRPTRPFQWLLILQFFRRPKYGT